MTTATPVDLSLACSLAECALGQRSGIVTAVRGKLRRLFCIRDGSLVYAASNVIEEQFSEFLVREKLVSVGDLAGVQRAASETSRGLTPLLLEREVLEAETLDSALEQHLRELLFATLDWSDGEATLARGRPDLDNEVTTRVACAAALVEYAREHPPSLPEVRARIGASTAKMILSPDRLNLLQHVEADPSVRQLLDGCDGERSVDELVASTPGEEEDKWRALYSMLLLGIVEPLAGSVEATGDLTRDDVLAQLERVENADHYAVLGLGSTSSADRIREAYYALARRFHPDRFRTGPLQDLREQVESYFASVTEAYNTLYNPRLRTAYDQQQAVGTEDKQEQDSAYLARENFRRGKALVIKGRFTDALTSLENAVKLDARNASYRLELAQLMARNPRLRERAEEHLIEVNRIDPSMADGYLALGDLYLKSARKDDALKQYREVLRWEPGHLEATERLRRLGLR